MLEKLALILVDIQNDFCPGGALAVPQGGEVVDVVNRLMPLFPYVVATQDWHPVKHISFHEQGGIWPPHCIQNTPGAELHPLINQREIDDYFHKAFTPEADAYSGFEGVNQQGESLDEALRERGITTIYVTGLATDYCVQATTLDGLKNGYKVYVVTDAVRAVNVNEGDGEEALKELQDQGARLVSSKELFKAAQVASTIGD